MTLTDNERQAARERRRQIHACPTCDELGWIETEVGDLTRCNHHPQIGARP